MDEPAMVSRLPEKPRNAPEIESMQVTCIRHCIGTGVPGDPFRIVDDYFDANGFFLARHDSYTTRAQGEGNGR